MHTNRVSRASAEFQSTTSGVHAQKTVPAEMRALVLDWTGFDHLAVRRIPTPRPGPRQLLARVDAAGICTSLIKLVEQGPKHQLVCGWDVARYPLILGDVWSCLRPGLDGWFSSESGLTVDVHPGPALERCFSNGI
jgi:hypothetical protein